MYMSHNCSGDSLQVRAITTSIGRLLIVIANHLLAQDGGYSLLHSTPYRTPWLFTGFPSHSSDSF